MVHGHQIVRWGKLDGYWEPNNPVGLGIGCAREQGRTTLAKVAEEVGPRGRLRQRTEMNI